VYINAIRSSFAKAYELADVCAKASLKSAFFHVAGLRGVCEDLIVLAFMSDKPRQWCNELITNLMLLENAENLEIQQRRSPWEISTNG
jgi:hypothetical protein